MRLSLLPKLRPASRNMVRQGSSHPAMSKLMPISLLNFWLCCAPDCVYTCTIHRLWPYSCLVISQGPYKRVFACVETNPHESKFKIVRGWTIEILCWWTDRHTLLQWVEQPYFLERQNPTLNFWDSKRRWGRHWRGGQKLIGGYIKMASHWADQFYSSQKRI